jgi:predicted nuclease of predicted toxin-antitoxin system
MGRLALLADEHVKRGYVNALRSSGFDVRWLDDECYEAGTNDSLLLARAEREARVTVTNDEDFIELADTRDHTGIIMYQQYGHTPRAFVRAVERIDRYLSPAAFRNHVEWLENWL